MIAFVQDCYASVNNSSMTESYLPNVYAPSYVSFSTVAEAAWPAVDPNMYVNPYNMNPNYLPNANVFGTYEYAQPSYTWYPGADYSDWGTGAIPDIGRAGYPSDYYVFSGGLENYGAANGDMNGGLEAKTFEQCMERLSLGDMRNDVGYNRLGSGGGQMKPTWASVAGQPGLQGLQKFPCTPLSMNKNMEVGSWNGRSNSYQHGGRARLSASAPYKDDSDKDTAAAPDGPDSSTSENIPNSGSYNPKEFDLDPKGARFFIIKSYSEDDIHRSIKYNIWCSTEYGNKRLDAAFQEREGKGQVYLLFSVNGSGHFCGIAQMLSAVDYDSTATVWAQNKWKGKFDVRWIYVKDVPNSQLRHIKLENNENKPVTNSRDTQEVPPEKGKQVLRIIHQYRHTTSIFDDFSHYDQRQDGDDRKVCSN